MTEQKPPKPAIALNPMSTVTADIEQMAEESDRDRADHAKLKTRSDAQLIQPHVRRILATFVALIDGGVDPVVVAKTALLGDRPGDVMYRLATRSAHLAVDERAAQAALMEAIIGLAPQEACLYLVVGAGWVATQFNVNRAMLSRLTIAAAKRLGPQKAIGAVDLHDKIDIDRNHLVEAFEHVQLPSYAPLEFSPA